MSAGGNEVASQFGTLFIECHIMTSLCGDNGSFHSGNTTTNYNNFLRLECRCNGLDLIVHSGRIYSASYMTANRLAHYAVVASYARTDRILKT